MINYPENDSSYRTMTNFLSSSSSIMNYNNHQDLLDSSSLFRHSSEVIVSPQRSSLMIHSNYQHKQRNHVHEQTDSDCDHDSSSSSSITNSSKLKKRRANLPKDSVRSKRKILIISCLF